MSLSSLLHLGTQHRKRKYETATHYERRIIALIETDAEGVSAQESAERGGAGQEGSWIPMLHIKYLGIVECVRNGQMVDAQHVQGGKWPVWVEVMLTTVTAMSWQRGDGNGSVAASLLCGSCCAVLCRSSCTPGRAAATARLIFQYTHELILK